MTTMEQIAFDQSRRASVPEMAEHLQDLLGQKVTAAIAGLTDPRLVGRWARGEAAADAEVARRLRDAFRVARLLGQADTPDTVCAWFLGMNPMLDDQAPAELIARDPARVMQAARAFVVSG
jgi:hypothetical protein